MLKVLGQTPAWLGDGTSGGNVFAPVSGSTLPSDSRRGPVLAVKLVASINSQIFTAVGNEIRWADLRELKHSKKAWARSSRLQTSSAGETGDRSDVKEHKVLQTNFPDRIVHLSISPSGSYMAVATTTALYVVVVPEPSLLYTSDPVVSARTFQIGSAVHNDKRPSIACLLWHPLGYDGSCLVSISADSAVRLWEMDINVRSSFMRATTTFNLLALSDALVVEDIQEAPPHGFSPDYDMTPISASFGAPDLTEGCWSPMTLWVAMTSGNIYSVCPLLPTKWVAPVLILTSVHAYIEAITTGTEQDLCFNGSAGAITDWYTSLENQFEKAGRLANFDPENCVLLRPATPSVPQVQGPFSGFQGFDIEEQAMDMIVAPLVPSWSQDSLQVLAADKPSPVLSHVVSLVSSFGMLYHNLDTQAASPRWLASFSDSYDPSLDEVDQTLVTIEVVDLLQDDRVDDISSPFYFCRDPISDWTYFVNYDCGIIQVFSPYLSQIASELADPSDDGLEDRLKVCFNSTLSECGHVSRATTDRNLLLGHPTDISASIAIQVIGVGCLILSVLGGRAIGALLESPDDRDVAAEDIEPGTIPTPDETEYLCLGPAPAVYVPPARFETPSTLLRFVESKKDSRMKKYFEEAITMSSYSLEFLMEVHQLLTKETHEFLTSASTLFVRCQVAERDLLNVLKGYQKVQGEIENLSAITGKPATKREQSPSSGSSNNGDDSTPSGTLDDRIEAAKARQKELNKRCDLLLSKVAHLAGQTPNAKEEAWMSEIKHMAGMVGLSIDDVDDEPTASDGDATGGGESPAGGAQPTSKKDDIFSTTDGANSALLDRIKTVFDISKELISESEAVMKKFNETQAGAATTSGGGGGGAAAPSTDFGQSTFGRSTFGRSVGGAGLSSREAAFKREKESRVGAQMAQLDARMAELTDSVQQLQLDTA